MAAAKKTFSSEWGHPNCPYWIDLIVQETKVNTEENYSEVFFDLRARSEETWDLEFRDKLGYISVDDTRIKESYTNLGAWDGDGGAYNRRICSITKKIYHNNDGKKTINIKGYYDYSGILISHKWYLSAVSVTGSYTLTSITRKPTFDISIKKQSAEQVEFNWSSNLQCNQIWIEYGSEPTVFKFPVDNKKSGTVKVTGLIPNTSYTMKAWGKSTAEKWSDPKTISVKTVETSALTSNANLIFGSSLEITKTNKTGFKDDIYWYVNGQLITSKKSIANTYILNFTQDELDMMYKLFGKENVAKTELKLVSHGTEDYVSSVTGLLTLTGNAKVIKLGVKGSPKRANVWVGVGKIPKRAVVWTGVKGTPRRSI